VKANKARVLRQLMENTHLSSSSFPIIFLIQQNKHNLGVGRLLILVLFSKINTILGLEDY